MFSILINSSRLVVSILLLGAIFLLAGCGGQDADSRYQKAQEFVAQDKQPEAIIELKNALKADKEHVPSRQMLAALYYQSGDFRSAEKEARRALEMEKNPETELLLDKTLLVMGRDDEVIGRLQALEPIKAGSQPNLAILKARTLMNKGDLQQAGEILESVQTESTTSVDLLIALTSYYVLSQDVERAQKVALQASESFPQRRKPWLTLGRIAMQEEDYQKALEYFQRAESAPAKGEEIPLVLDVIYGKSVALVRLGQNEEAIAELDRYLARYGDVPQLQYLKGLAQFQLKALKESRETLSAAIRNQPDFSPALLLLGTVEYQQGRLELARQYIRDYVVQRPEDPVGKRLLGELELRLNSPEKAFEVLKPLSEDAVTGDGDLLALAGESAMQAGSKELGVSYYRKAAELNPDDRKASIQYALALMRVDKTDQAISILSALKPSNTAPFTRESLLVQAYARSGDSAKINQLSKDVSTRLAEDASAQKFVGDVNLAQGNLDQAQIHYQKALNIDNAYVDALVGLAQLELRRGQFDKAYERSLQAYQNASDNENVVIYHARVINRVKGYKPAIELLREYVLDHENASRSIAVLVQLAVQNKDQQEVLSLVDYLEQEKIDDERMLNLAIRLALDIGETERADRLFAQLQSNYSNEASFLNTASNLHLQAGRLELAREHVQRLLSLDPDHSQGLIMAASLEATNGNYNKALEYVQKVPAEGQNSARYFLLAGQIEEVLQQYPQAADYYLQGLKMSDNLMFLSNLYRIARAAPNKGIEQMANAWAKENQSSVDPLRIKAIQAQHYTANKEYAKAALEYEGILAFESASDDPSMMNNLAWNLFHAGNYEKSLQVATKAYQMSNENPYIGDTLGWIMVNNKNQLTQGVALLRSSYEKSEGHPDVGYHLAYGLSQSGNNVEAKDILKTIVESGRPFESRAQAMKLLQSIE